MLIFPMVADVECHLFKPIVGEDATLFVRQVGQTIPFVVRRIFTVHAHKRTVRGFHAHKACSQALACLVGKCDVVVDDGTNRKRFTLDDPAKTLLIRPGLWAEQHYDASDTILMVMCDSEYDESDYLRDYDAFLSYRRQTV